MEDWHYLTLLHYLNTADGTKPTGVPMSFGAMPGGIARGGDLDRRAAAGLEKFLSSHDEKAVSRFFRGLSGEENPGKADRTYRLFYFPRLPIYVNIWFADEEFPPSARLLLDESAGHYVSVEGAVTVGEHILSLLSRG